MTAEEIYNTYKDSIYRVCLRYTKNNDDALDVVQEVFIKIFKSMDQFRKQANMYTWVYRIAVNTSIDYLRSKQRDPDMDDELLYEISEDHCNLEDIDTRLTLMKILETFDSADRETLFLHYIEGLSHQEISLVMGVSRAAISKKLLSLESSKKAFAIGMILIFFTKISSQVAFSTNFSSN